MKIIKLILFFLLLSPVSTVAQNSASVQKAPAIPTHIDVKERTIEDLLYFPFSCINAYMPTREIAWQEITDTFGTCETINGSPGLHAGKAFDFTYRGVAIGICYYDWMDDRTWYDFFFSTKTEADKFYNNLVKDIQNAGIPLTKDNIYGGMSNRKKPVSVFKWVSVILPTKVKEVSPSNIETAEVVGMYKVDLGVYKKKRNHALVLAPVGMEAKNKVKKEEVPQLLNYPSAEWGEYRMHGGEMVIKGHVTADDPAKIKQLNNNVDVIIHDYIVRKEQTIPIKIEENGTFSLNIHVPYPMFVLVYPMAGVYACPGDTVEITFDATKPMQRPGDNVTLSGKGVSAEASKLYIPLMYKYLKSLKSEAHVAHPDSLLRWRDAQVEKLDDLVRQMNAGLPELEGCSPRTSDILRTSLVSEYLYEICHRYFMFMDFLKENESAYSIDKEAYWQQYFSFLAPREKYLLDNPLLMIAADESFFNRMEYTLMEPVERSSIKGSTLAIDYYPEAAERLTENSTLSLREARRQAMNKLHEKLNLNPTNFCAQVCMVRDLFYKLEWGTNYDYSAEDVASTLPYITNLELMRRAVLQYREFVKTKETEKQYVDASSLRPSTDVEGMSDGEKILRKLIEPYQGKIIYVDIWGTWCAPCRANLKEWWRVREALKDYDIVYLFLANNSSDKAWKSVISEYNLTGPNCIHYNLPADQQSAIERYIGVNGYPTYKLIDKQGNIYPLNWQHTDNINSLIETVDKLNK